jgi:hypothetical protein
MTAAEILSVDGEDWARACQLPKLLVLSLPSHYISRVAPFKWGGSLLTHRPAKTLHSGQNAVGVTLLRPC